MKVVSLFSGIGGFEVGLKKSKIKGKVVFASEIDENARKSYIANWGSNNFAGDITKVDEKNVPSHDLLMAGFPCQSFSIAGKRKGFEDTRGTLFFDVARILNEKKPKYILLENVKNLISHDKTETIRMILKTLNDIGYTVDFTVINSCEAGVPQNRDRTYICGIYGLASEPFDDDVRSSKANALKKEFNNTDFKGFNFFNHVKFKNKKKYIDDILETDVDASFYFDTVKIRDFLSTLSVQDGEKHESRIIKLFDLPRDVHKDLERQRRVYSTKGISPTVLARADTTKILIDDGITKKIRKVTPIENFYIQGFEKKFVENIKNIGMSVTQMYKQSGNAVSPPVITGILNYLESQYISCE
jgi:DNA (cytosine-5)-methyltransferase 1